MKMLRFLLSYGHSIDILDTPTNCNTIVDRWESGGYALAGNKRLSGVDQFGRKWCLLIDNLIGILVQDPPKEVQELMNSMGQPGIKWPFSGRN